MSSDLVKRLRRADTCIFPTERDRCHCGEAADRILKLEAENAELKSEVNTVRLAAKYAAKIRDARIEKLEEALLGIRVYGNDTMSGPADGSEDNRNWYRVAVIAMKNRARKALEGKDDVD